MSVLSISEVSQLSVTAMALRLEYILDLARLFRSSDLLKMLRALHVSTYGNVIFSEETLRSPAIQPTFPVKMFKICMILYIVARQILLATLVTVGHSFGFVPRM